MNSQQNYGNNEQGDVRKNKSYRFPTNRRIHSENNISQNRRIK